MPPRAAPRRQASRIIKREPVDEAPSEALVQAEVSQDDNGNRVTKIDNETDEESTLHAQAEPTGENSMTSMEQELPAAPEGGGKAEQEPQSGTASTSQSRTRGAQPAKRFQTRAGIVRKSEADRKKLEKEEEQRRQRRLAEATRGQRGAQRSRGDRAATRGRGGAAAAPKSEEAVGTSWAFERTAETPRPSFGGERVLSGPSSNETAAGTGGTSYGGSGSTGGRGRASVRRKGATGEDIREEEADIDRTDIDHINLISDEEIDEDAIPGKGRRRHIPQEGGLRPIRLEKHEHVNRAVGIEATKLKAEQNIKEEAFEKADVLGKVKEHAVAEAEEQMELDQLPEPTTMKREVEVKAPLPPDSRKLKAERKRRPSNKDYRLAHETVEEQQERIRYEKDLRKISRELGSLGQEPAAAEEDTSTTFGRDGRLFLFQLPPMTPMLVRPGEEHAEGADETSGSGGPAPSASNAHGKAPEVQVKKEPGTEGSSAPQARKQILTAGDARLPGGFVGKLNVHQSGKVTLDWGGTSMVVNWGTEVDFLQDAVLAVPKSEDRDATAYSLAQVRNKLVVTPDWQKIYE